MVNEKMCADSLEENEKQNLKYLLVYCEIVLRTSNSVGTIDIVAMDLN
jgi:hypothetical protein